jgi:hypothetical protein
MRSLSVRRGADGVRCPRWPERLCVGAGVTGASVFALTAWLVLGGMWLGAGLTDLLVDRSSALPLHEAASSAVPKA